MSVSLKIDEEGIEEGRKEGIEEGRKEGLKKAKLKWFVIISNRFC